MPEDLRAKPDPKRFQRRRDQIAMALVTLGSGMVMVLILYLAKAFMKSTD